MRAKILVGAIIAIGIIIITAAQFSVPVVIGADGYYHIRVAQFLREHGLRYPFHWARYSIFAEHFADKDFLYHVFLIPFTFLKNIFFGVKLAAVLNAVFLYLAFFYVLRRAADKVLLPVFLSAFLLSPSFLSAISSPRPMVGIMALTLLFVHCLILNQRGMLFGITLAYSLMHVSGPHLILFAGLCEAARWLSEGKFGWKNIAGVSAAVALSFLIHPNFPNNLYVFYINGIMVPLFALKWGIELGAEFFPSDTRDFVLGYPLVLPALILLVAAATGRNQIPTRTKMWLALTGFFFVFLFFSKRYAIHAYPLILVSGACYLSDWLRSRRDPGKFYRHKPLVIGALVLCAAALILLGRHTYKMVRAQLQSERVYNQHYEAVGAWMKENLPAGEVIFHTNWSDSQFFIGLNPKDDYFVTLDPTYMYYWNKDKYNLYRQIAFGSCPDPYLALAQDFGVTYGYAGKNYFSAFINQVRSDSRFQVLAEDGLGLVFRLTK